ncbi:MAG: hypothetical protein WA691_06040 [Thermoplasmata archaeon]
MPKTPPQVPCDAAANLGTKYLAFRAGENAINKSLTHAVPIGAKA